ncbi:hypothetical protein SDC9_127989 [bioreactor metagenome]|uniref:Uncharacterized protein n=1 Tax=bioreactor metagenome TaxID=1076179 RepID=A0A645CVR1_9ZZZZ
MHLDFSAHYIETMVRDKMPSEEEIEKILAMTGKITKDDMLNCGTCGYPSCRDKAIAVYQGKADIRMCLPYMRERAESMSNRVFENTPNAIFMLDRDLCILEMNQAAKSLFGLPAGASGTYIGMLLDTTDFEQFRETGKPVLDAHRPARDGKHILRQSISAMPDGDYLVIVSDVTTEEEERREHETLRRETLDTAQKVIDKQMRVAQEIASLLGETTGETKAALTKLKRSIIQGEDI